MKTRLRMIFHSLLLCAPIYMIYGLIEAKPYAESADGPMKIAAYAAGVFFGFLLTFLIALILSYMHRRINLIVLLNSEFEQNGYSDKYIDILNDYLKKNASKDSLFHRCQFYTFLANAYLYKQDVQAAIYAIGNITPEEIRYGLKASNKLHLAAILSFFDIEMQICAELHNPDRADAVMRDAEPYIKPFYGKSGSMDNLIDEINASFYMAHNDYENAVASIGTRSGKSYGFIASLIKCRVYIYFGKKEEAMNLLNSVKPMASSPVYKPQHRMCEEEYRRKFGDI